MKGLEGIYTFSSSTETQNLVSIILAALILNYFTGSYTEKTDMEDANVRIYNLQTMGAVTTYIFST